MNRKILKTLLEWKNSKKPFMLVGARQVGKTFILDTFCKIYYENYIYINLERDKEICKIFEETINPEEIVKLICLVKDIKINPENTIIFFDEIQISEQAINSLKYFSESKTHYNIVCAGSLLGVALNRMKSSFPVGQVYIETLHPFDFEEFLWAIDKKSLAEEITKYFFLRKPMPSILHNKLIEIYKDYLFTGGMPASIIEYIDKQFKLEFFDRNVKHNLLDSYSADMSKYTTNTEAIKIRKIYNSIPKQLGQDRKKFNYRLVESNSNKRSLKPALQWLIDSKLLLECNLVEIPDLPIAVYKNENIFKMYLNDTGLLCELADISPSDFHNLGRFKGSITENYIAQALTANKINLYFWRSGNTAEIDFLINIDGQIIPVEVKAATNTKSKSLQVYKSRYNPELSIRLSGKNFGVEQNIFYIPLYAAYLIKEGAFISL